MWIMDFYSTSIHQILLHTHTHTQPLSIPQQFLACFVLFSLVIRTNSWDFWHSYPACHGQRIPHTFSHPFTLQSAAATPSLSNHDKLGSQDECVWCFSSLLPRVRLSRFRIRPPLNATVEWIFSYIHERMCDVPRRKQVRQWVCVRGLTKYAKFVHCYLCLQRDKRDWFIKHVYERLFIFSCFITE